jgi:transposase
LDEKIPQDSSARLVNQIVDNLDIAEIVDTYKRGGTSAYHPRMVQKFYTGFFKQNSCECKNKTICLKPIENPSFHKQPCEI